MILHVKVHLFDPLVVPYKVYQAKIIVVPFDYKMKPSDCVIGLKYQLQRLFRPDLPVKIHFQIFDTFRLSYRVSEYLPSQRVSFINFQYLQLVYENR